MKKIYWIHGTKGGVGKSMTATILTNYLLDEHGAVTVVESDGSAPDVGRRFVDIDGVNTVSAPITDAASIYDALIKLEDVVAEHVVINLPANAEVLDKKADEIAEVTEALEYENRCMFVIGAGNDSARLAGNSMVNGLASICTKSIAVVNQFFGNAITDFAWATSKEAEAWVASGRAKILLPCLDRRITKNPIFISPVTLSSLADMKKSPLKITERMMVRRWLASGYDVCEQIAGGE